MEHRSGYVSIVGSPNVGKSTLLNRLLGEKLAIVSARPQTTRNRILAIHGRPGFQMVFLDTPGIHRPKGEMGRYMVEAALSAAGEADIGLLVIDAAFPWGPLDRLSLERLAEAAPPPPLVLAVNKIDLAGGERLAKTLAESAGLYDFRAIFPLSALTGEGVAALEDELFRLLPQGPPYFPEDQLSDLPERFLAAETVREKIFRLMRQELPYSTAVMVESFEEGKELLRIGAEIIVERDSQKGMIIGKKGAMIVKIGRAARLDLEAFFAMPVRLDLFVKVRKNWTRDPEALKRMGYGGP